MTPFHYKAKILPDGHLPVPEDCHVRAGEEVEVTLLPAEHGNGAAEAAWASPSITTSISTDVSLSFHTGNLIT
jgi:hypothetical protein